MLTSLSDNVIGLYQRRAAEWDAARRRGAWNDRAWIEAFIGELASARDVLDLGCGGGIPVAQFLVEHGMKVTGVDSSPRMIAMARDRMPMQEWTVADMRQLAFDRRFDGILAWDSFFHLAPDAQRKMFAVFAAHAGDDAVLMFNTGPESGEAISTSAFEGEQLYHASLAPDEYRLLLDQYGFEVIRFAANDMQGGGRTGWLCRRRPRPARANISQDDRKLEAQPGFEPG